MDERPGLNTMMLNMLGRTFEEDPDKHGHVTLMLDAMSIKKHLQYNPRTKQMSGYVDLGNGCNETDPATEALVLMVVGLKGHWKAPVFPPRSHAPLLNFLRRCNKNPLFYVAPFRK